MTEDVDAVWMPWSSPGMTKEGMADIPLLAQGAQSRRDAEYPAIRIS
jgi:hypothetical protein